MKNDLRVRTRRDAGKSGRRKFDKNFTAIIADAAYTSVTVADHFGDSCGFAVDNFDRRFGSERRQEEARSLIKYSCKCGKTNTEFRVERGKTFTVDTKECPECRTSMEHKPNDN